MKNFKKNLFGKIGNQKINLYTFENDRGHCLEIMNYGACIRKYTSPDKEGIFSNIVLSLDRLEDYIDTPPNFGFALGPVAGRIGNASFKLGDDFYKLEKNLGDTHLHSASTGFNKSVFKVESVDNNGIVMFLDRPHMTGGYPGNLKTWIEYRLGEDGSLAINYRAKSDKDTLFNPSNHSYFNLGDDIGLGLRDHVLKIRSNHLVPIDSQGLPIEDYNPTNWNPDQGLARLNKEINRGMDLEDIFSYPHPQIQDTNGLDHPFYLDKHQSDSIEEVALLSHRKTGRSISLKTSAPCLVVYTANGPNPGIKINGKQPPQHMGIALETQIMPDAINRPYLGNIILKKDQVFTSTTIITPDTCY